jgi:molecular chaperone GrpE
VGRGLSIRYCTPMEPVNTPNGVATEDLQPETESGSETSEQRDTSAASTAELIAERDRLAKEKNELQELLQRRQAEFENYRRRAERERSELFEFATMDAVKTLLPILDDFERALKVESADKEYARGMELIYQRLFEALKKMGLEPISTEEGELFNPHVHHAVEMVDTKDHPDQTILEEYQRGYNFKGRLIRPAMLKVAVNR